MKNSVLTKVLTSFLIGAGAWAYSCSGDDLFEEDNDVRTLAKRSMSRSGEHTVPGVSEYAVYKIKSGFCHDVSSVSGDCTISLSWTEGFRYQSY